MPADEYLQAVLLGRDTLDAVDNAAVRALPPGDHFATHLHGTMELIICTGGQHHPHPVPHPRHPCAQ